MIGITRTFKFAFAIFTLAHVSDAMAWGSLGHKATGEIAARFLSDDAKREIAAMTSLMKIRDKHDPRKSSSKKKTLKALNLLIKRHPGTLAAQKAEKQLSGG